MRFSSKNPMIYYQPKSGKPEDVKTKSAKFFLYGPILFKTSFICFISIFFICGTDTASGAEKFPKIKSKSYADEAQWLGFLLTTEDSPVIFEGKSKEAGVVPGGFEYSFSPLLMISFENLQFLKGEPVPDKKFPIPGKISRPGRYGS